MPGAKSDCLWSPCSDDGSEQMDYRWADSVTSKGSLSDRGCAHGAGEFLLSPDASSGGYDFAGQGMRGSNIVAPLERATVTGNNSSWRGCYPAAAAQEQQSQRNTTPGLLAAIVDGAVQAASVPGLLSVSAAGPQRISISSLSATRSARPASSMLSGPSLLDLQSLAGWQ